MPSIHDLLLDSATVGILWDSTVQTLYMVSVSLLLSVMIGGPLGILLATTRRGELFEMPWFQGVVGPLVNAARSVPFIILAVAIIPFTRLVAGTSIGTTAAIVPLTVAAVPFLARIVEGAVREVDAGLVEAAQAMGARPLQVVFKVLLPEALPGLIHGVTLAMVAMIGYSAMVGAVGGGGLGDLGIRYGYQRFRPDVMIAVVVILVALVQGLQTLGDWLARRADKRNIQ